MKLITESTFDITTSINEDNKSMYIEGVFATAERKNKNGRVYPKSLLEREITSVLKIIGSNSCVGELNHPTDRSETDLNEAAIKITELNWKGNDVYGKAKVLSTPKGKIVHSLLSDGVKIGISSRGLGTVSEGQVNDDFNLLTWDVVSNPSNHDSWVNGILEGKEFGEVKDIKEDTEEEKDAKKLQEEIDKKLENAEMIYNNLKDYSKTL